MLKRLHAGRFDALWVHGYARFDNLTAMAAARALGVRVLVRDEASSDSAPRGPVRRVLKRLFFRLLRGMCDGFTVIGARNAAYYREHGVSDRRMFSVPYAVDNEFFRRGAAAAAQRRF